MNNHTFIKDYHEALTLHPELKIPVQKVIKHITELQEDYVFGAGPDFTMNLEDFGFDTVYGQDVMECVVNGMFPWYRARLDGTKLIARSRDKTHQPSAEIITSGLS